MELEPLAARHAAWVGSTGGDGRAAGSEFSAGTLESVYLGKVQRRRGLRGGKEAFVGFGVDAGFMGVVEDAGRRFVGLTDAGREFADLENPWLHGGDADASDIDVPPNPGRFQTS